MGCCLSKKEPPPPPPPEPAKPISRPEPDEKPTTTAAKREIFVIKHRRSHEIPEVEKTEPVSDSGMVSSESSGQNLIASNINLILKGTGPTRASSCTKEEVDAILIQCGRLSRSSSGAARKYSGSKRSYDFDNDGLAGGAAGYEEDDGSLEKRVHGRSRVSSPQGSRRRRTPSRERDQRSNSRERNINGSGSRRVSRSPGRRSETNSSTTNNANGNVNGNNKPGKMVSVPATVTSLTGAGAGAGEPVIKRVTVRRNVSSPRTQSPARGYPNGSSENPRAWSPARTNPNGSAENPRARSPARMNQNGSTENPRARSPARTNENHQQQALGRSSSRRGEQSPFRRNPLSEIDPNSLAYPQPLTRSRSSRRSQDLDLNTEALLNPNPNPSYTSLLLEDIQNFHQKNTSSQMPPASFSLPACVTKACSIVEAVADLNSGTSSGLTDQISGKRRQIQQQQRQPKCPFVESEVAIIDDLMEPSFQKYVTVSRGGAIEEEEESSGSNSVVCGNSQQQHRGISNSSSWEPTSSDSTDRSREIEEARRGFSGKRRGFDHHGNQGPRSLTVGAAAAST